MSFGRKWPFYGLCSDAIVAASAVGGPGLLSILSAVDIPLKPAGVLQTAACVAGASKHARTHATSS